MKKGKFVYRDENSMKKMQEFYEKTLESLCVPYVENYFDRAIVEMCGHAIYVGLKA